MSAKLLPASAITLLALQLIAAAAPASEIEATFPVEVLAVDPALAAGGIPLKGAWSSPRIAMQPVRAVRAAVLEKSRDVLMLALLEPAGRTETGQVRLDGPPDRIAWCASARLGGTVLNCYQDLDSDGRFETARYGLLGIKEPLALSRMQAPRAIEPVTYRAATTDELPVFHVGYQACAVTKNDLPASFEAPFRFETRVQRPESAPWADSARCDTFAKFVETRPDGARLYEVGRFRVEVRPRDEKQLATTLVEGIAPGTVLSHVRSSWPLTDATDRPQGADAIAMGNSFLVSLGTPVVVAQARPGDQIFTVEVRHALAGRLSADSEPGRKRGDLRLPMGTPVYGIAMRSRLTPLQDAEVIWCTPIEQTQGLTPYCFVPKYGSATLQKAYARPFTVSSIVPSGPVRNLPAVETGPAEFGAPLVLAVRLTADGKDIGVHWSLAPRGEWYQEAAGLGDPRKKSSLLLIGPMLLKIQPTQDGQTFEVTTRGEIVDGSPVDMPVDARRLLR